MVDDARLAERVPRRLLVEAQVLHVRMLIQTHADTSRSGILQGTSRSVTPRDVAAIVTEQGVETLG